MICEQPFVQLTTSLLFFNFLIDIDFRGLHNDTFFLKIHNDTWCYISCLILVVEITQLFK